MTKISVVIVTYNSAAVIERCLSALDGADAVVVDNASSDGSARLAGRLGAKVIVNAKNLGFGRACNIGAKACVGDYILFLNPDAVATAASLHALKTAALHYPQAGAIGARLMEADRPAPFQSTTYMQAQSGRVIEGARAPAMDSCVSFLSGAALMCKREAFDAVGGFDDAIFLYYEDDDLCHRLSQRGWQLIYAPGAVVSHAKGRSSKRSLRGDYARHYHMAASRLYISRKYSLNSQSGLFMRRAATRALRSLALLNIHKAARHVGMLHAYAEALLQNRSANAARWRSHPASE